MREASICARITAGPAALPAKRQTVTVGATSGNADWQYARVPENSINSVVAVRFMVRCPGFTPEAQMREENLNVPPIFFRERRLSPYNPLNRAHAERRKL